MSTNLKPNFTFFHDNNYKRQTLKLFTEIGSLLSDVKTYMFLRRIAGQIKFN